MKDVNGRKLAVLIAAGRVAAGRLANRGVGVMENIGWKDEARAASLAVRRRNAMYGKHPKPPSGGSPRGGSGIPSGVVYKAPPAAIPLADGVPGGGGVAASPDGSTSVPPAGLRYDPNHPPPGRTSVYANPDTEYEGQTFYLDGYPYKVENGVLVNLTTPLFPGPQFIRRTGTGSGQYMKPIAEDLTKKLPNPSVAAALREKLDAAGVFVPGYSETRGGPEQRRY